MVSQDLERYKWLMLGSSLVAEPRTSVRNKWSAKKRHHYRRTPPYGYERVLRQRQRIFLADATLHLYNLTLYSWNILYLGVFTLFSMYIYVRTFVGLQLPSSRDRFGWAVELLLEWSL